MARIRSIHPGLWTDETFVELSMAARILYLGILTEADDHGVFEWKPTALKMRIFPADTVDVTQLLDELERCAKVCRKELDDCIVGIVRNFRKYQRPKKPTYRFIFKNEWADYVGLTEVSTEPVENQFGTGGENPPQRKEEGGRREKKKEDDAANAAPSKYVFENGIIKLNKRDFDLWQASFSHLDLRAELIGLTQWAGEQRSWFNAVSGALAKRNREVKAAKDVNGSFKWNGIEGVL